MNAEKKSWKLLCTYWRISLDSNRVTAWSCLLVLRSVVVCVKIRKQAVLIPFLLLHPYIPFLWWYWHMFVSHFPWLLVYTKHKDFKGRSLRFLNITIMQYEKMYIFWCWKYSLQFAYSSNDSLLCRNSLFILSFWLWNLVFHSHEITQKPVYKAQHQIQVRSWHRNSGSPVLIKGKLQWNFN